VSEVNTSQKALTIKIASW